MAKKRSYDVNTIVSGYEETLELQNRRESTELTSLKEVTEAKAEPEPIKPAASPITTTPITENRYENDYVNPDQEEYKRMSLFMDWETWERIQALCWNANEPVNRLIVDKLREWSLDIPNEILEKYRMAMKQKHLEEWAKQRDILQYWWQTSDLREQMNIQSFHLKKNFLTVVEITGTVHNYYIHRGWVTDGCNKFAKEKILWAQLRRIN